MWDIRFTSKIDPSLEVYVFENRSKGLQNRGIFKWEDEGYKQCTLISFYLDYIISIRYAQSDRLKTKEDVLKGKKAEAKNISLNS